MDGGQSTTDTAARSARNRANATKSTGPRTPAGKSRSAQNARTHGLTAATPPTQIPVPDPCARLEYTTALIELRTEHRPASPTQHALVDELALVLWKLQYLPRVEHRLLNTPLPDPTPQPDPAHITPHPRLDHEFDPTAAVLAAHFASDRPTPLTRLFNHHHRLQARCNSLLNQLRRLKRDHRNAADDDADPSHLRPHHAWTPEPDRPPSTLSEIPSLHPDPTTPAQTCHNLPNPATAPHASAPAQNEATSAAPQAPTSQPTPPEVPSSP